ncbi:hypothetical protein CYMTET_18408 [Cymbomonas tetramitiformis]|uniref:Uncharacterized protein n=1 Tax=Cymbomonas tetramitiformis TaxID=36881 RepID=A0AAE0G8F7_9CHLO|nr:hypothetical protein CYMTET_18408 [Cymbomonas tetramitiformis]
MDCEYALDSNKKWIPKPLLAGEFKQFLHNFNNLTTCDDWVGGCFCGFQQHHEFFEAAKQFCHRNAEKMFWVKPLSRSNMMTLESGVAPRNYANRMECFVLCYYVKEATPTDETHPAVHKRLPWMKNLIRVLGEEENADSDVVDKQFVASCRTNTWEYAPVHSSKFANNSEEKRINKHQKPLKLIHDLVNIHMRVLSKQEYDEVKRQREAHRKEQEKVEKEREKKTAVEMRETEKAAKQQEAEAAKAAKQQEVEAEKAAKRQQAEAAEADKAAKQQQAEAVKAAKKEKADAEKAAKQQADAEKAAKKQKAEAAKKEKAEADKAAKAAAAAAAGPIPKRQAAQGGKSESDHQAKRRKR